MILGIGSDLTDIRRIEASLERFGDRFVQRCFTPEEQNRAEGKPDRAARYAKRFSAKEACAKALRAGFRDGVGWRDIGVVNDSLHAPSLALTGGAAERLAALTPAGHQARIHVTLADDWPWAQAFVVIEALPTPQ